MNLEALEKVRATQAALTVAVLDELRARVRLDEADHQSRNDPPDSVNTAKNQAENDYLEAGQKVMAAARTFVTALDEAR